MRLTAARQGQRREDRDAPQASGRSASRGAPDTKIRPGWIHCRADSTAGMTSPQTPWDPGSRHPNDVRFRMIRRARSVESRCSFAISARAPGGDVVAGMRSSVRAPRSTEPARHVIFYLNGRQSGAGDESSIAKPVTSSQEGWPASLCIRSPLLRMAGSVPKPRARTPDSLELSK